MAYSRYGSSGKGLTDRGSRRYARKLSGSAYKKYTTFTNRAGNRIAKGSWQVIGHTTASLGSGKGMSGYQVTGDTGLSGYEFLAKYQAVGVSPQGNKLYMPRGGVQLGDRSPMNTGGFAPEGVRMTQGVPIEGTIKGMGNLVAPHYGGMRWLGGARGLPPAVKESNLGGLLTVGGLAYIVMKVLL